MSVHVIPADDIINHPLTDDCPCGPHIETVKRADGTIGWLHVHAPLDGREPNKPDQT